MSQTVHRLPTKTYNTRRNLPATVGRKRGESNFMRAFERCYFARQCGGMAAGEFALGGFGVADLVWIAWRPDPSQEDFTAVSVQRQLSRRKLFAFEAKLKDWQRGLQQAFRYRYFADKAVVVLPAENARPAIAHLETFRQLQVGLWTFETSSGIIKEHFTPTHVRALNPNARKKAIAVLSSKLDLRKFREKLKATT